MSVVWEPGIVEPCNVMPGDLEPCNVMACISDLVSWRPEFTFSELCDDMFRFC